LAITAVDDRLTRDKFPAWGIFDFGDLRAARCRAHNNHRRHALMILIDTSSAADTEFIRI
jgi:hypothetical protein